VTIGLATHWPCLTDFVVYPNILNKNNTRLRPLAAIKVTIRLGLAVYISGTAVATNFKFGVQKHYN